ncbi:hypothetical protein PCE31106_00006 [Pandoraea cepalis]|uniref:Uncharacterized protein n=1 Tax=Pandoraea cepalis TaxID=2508294 RepID=A0A5E4RAM3_9BURK|nr:hypothetical protein PCE31106_00006 [Pandoraea cepalis]
MPPLLFNVAFVVKLRFGATMAPPLFVSEPVRIVSFVPAPISPPSFASVSLVSVRSVFDSSLPFALSTAPPSVAVSPVCPMIRPAALSRLPARATTCPLLVILPPAFESVPVPFPAFTVSAPAPACVIVPPWLSSMDGANVRSTLFVCSVPPAELSSKPRTATRIDPVPVCVIVPA